MKIIKHGNLYSNKKRKCPECGCIFVYRKVKFTACTPYVTCPECKNDVYILSKNTMVNEGE